MSKHVLIVARSGRQLAAAARAGGYTPLVADLFGDIDTETVCTENILLSARNDFSFDGPELIDALRTIRSGYGSMPLVWGSGWESQPHLLAAIGQSWAIKGCPVATLFVVNDPRTFSRGAARSGIRIPSFTSGRVPTNGQWLLKRRGSCGGFGVTLTGSRRLTGQREYLQRKVAGVCLSAAFVASSHSVSVSGVCEALNLQPDLDVPYRFSAAIAAPHWFEKLRGELTRITGTLAKLYTLRGLCGIDFIVDEIGGITLIELNARPPATFDLLVDPGRAFQAHMDPDTLAYGSPPVLEQVRAMAICYAEHPIVVTKTLNWPEWVADRPRIGTRLLAGMPVCSVSAAAPTVTQTKGRLKRRFERLLNQLRSASPTR